MSYSFVFIISALIVLALTPLVKLFALRWNVLDAPGELRKIHARPTPLLGGVAIFLGLTVMLLYLAQTVPDFLKASISLKQLIGIILAGLILMVGGVLDDKYNLKPARQLIWSILAILVIIVSGVGVRLITNPLGGTISLVWWEKVLFFWQGVPYRLTFPADLFTFIWLFTLMYTTKLLDGLDGLVSGMTTIGALMIFLLATITSYYQPEVGRLALTVAGAFTGFLIWNWHPAKIFLGTGGSTLAGFLLGTLAIISGGKIATALLVMGIPILDVIWVVLRRACFEKKSPTSPDRKHLHFRLLDAGLSHRSVVILLLITSAVFGATTLFLQSTQKLIALGLLAGLMIIIALGIVRANQRRHK